MRDPGVPELPRGHKVQNQFIVLYTVHVYSVTRYLEARRMLAKAAQYRPAKYKKVSPTPSPVTVSVSGEFRTEYLSLSDESTVSRTDID